MSQELGRVADNALTVAHPSHREMIAAADGVLLDWDGCFAVSNKPTPDAVAFLRAMRDRVAIVSNNSSNLPDDIAAILAAHDVAIDRRRILLAGVEAIRRAREMAPAEAQVLGDRRMRAHARNEGLTLVRQGGDVVVLLRDPQFSYARLERAANALRRGARLIVANPDLTHPGSDGAVVPETGALLRALEACVDLKAVAVEMIGKPAPRLFRMACAALGVEPSRAVMIGDNPTTDVAGASAVDMPAILVDPRQGATFEALL